MNTRKPQHAEKIIALKSISFSYGKNLILKDISLDVHAGDYLGIIGSNGAGKTTLLKVILGLLQPKSGSVEIFGTDLTSFKDWPRIGYLPQSVARFDQSFPATVFEVVMMGRYAKLGVLKKPGAGDREAAKDALQEVGMWEFKDRLIGELSGGQQQRVFIARALVSDPEVIFFDEPTVGIDQASRVDFYSLLRDLNKHHGIALVLISHDLKTVLEEAKHVAYIDHELVFCGPSKEFMQHKNAQNLLDEHLHLDDSRHQ